MSLAQKWLLRWQCGAGAFFLLPALYGLLVVLKTGFRPPYDHYYHFYEAAFVAGILLGIVIWAWNIQALNKADYSLVNLRRLWWWNLAANAIYAAFFFYIGMAFQSHVASIVGLYPALIITLFITYYPTAAT